MERQTFRKKSGTGMHVVRNFKPGTKVNGQEVSGRAILRPGNTVFCFPEELGIDGLRQFDVVSRGVVTDATESIQGQKGAEPSKPKTTLIMQKRPKGSFWDIINPLNPDKPINPKALTKRQAEEMLVELTEGEGTIVHNIDEMGWDELVQLLEQAKVEWDDDWESEDDLRDALRKIGKD